MKPKSHTPKRRRRGARRARVRRSIERSGHTRLTVYRSAKHIYAQLIDPVTGHTIGSVSTRSRQLRKRGEATGNVEAAKRIGKAVAELAREKQIERVVFNRNGFLYHGRVKALAEAARKEGLRF